VLAEVFMLRIEAEARAAASADRANECRDRASPELARDPPKSKKCRRRRHNSRASR
jgi:hypothetical protein